MKITPEQLTKLELDKNVTITQSDFDTIAYATSRSKGVIWMIDRQSGAQVEIAKENVQKLAYELMDVAHVHLGG